MMQSVVVGAGLLAWWGCACRIGQMHRGEHRWSAMLWHWGLAAVSLAAAASAIRPDLPPLGLAVSLSVVMYLSVTLPQWEQGPPAWARRQP